MYAVSIVTRLMNEGILDLKSGDLIQAHNDRQFFNKSLSTWEACQNVEFKTSHTSPTYREKIPVRTTLRILKRIHSESKAKSVKAMLTLSIMYRNGFILPQSELLAQAWAIFSTNCAPEIGGKVISYKELLKELRKHLKAAYATSADGYHVYCKEYLDKVERWSVAAKDSDDGFLVYAFTPKTNTYILTDAFIRNEDKWLSVYCVFADASLTPSKKRLHGVPADIGRFNVSNKDSRIVIPIKHNSPELDDSEQEYLMKTNAFNINAFANTYTAEQATILKFQTEQIKTYTYIDARVNETIKEMTRARARIQALRKGESAQELSLKYKAMVKENTRLEAEAYDLYKRKLKKHGEKVGLKYQKRYQELSAENQTRLLDFSNKCNLISLRYEDKSKKVIMDKLAPVITVKDGMTEAETLQVYLRRVKFIHNHASDIYDSYIDTVNKHNAKQKRYEKLVRDTKADIASNTSDKKHRELNKLLNKYTRLRTKYRECLKNLEAQLAASRKHLQHIDAAVSVMKIARKNPDWITVNVNPERKKRFRPAVKFEITPRTIACISATKQGEIKSNLKQKLQSIGFTV